ncbi:MAG: transcriptional regulator [Alphaproteobacteria bacterium]|nr:transcriptional regulator [Alphaproteobacteria bacterium]
MKAFDIHSLDDVIHGRIRLGVMAYLVGAETTDFTALRTHLNATDGNLSVHLRKLEEAGYITLEKSFRDRKPLTTVSLTKSGREAFVQYLDSIARLIR